jgi:ABC-type Fe3+/spermidine/putrescine transport system ATPase subunit/ABC-type spermidine/putrescine transport system permease subunit II
MSEMLLGRPGRRVLASYGWLIAAFLILPSVVLIPISFSAQTAFVFPPPALSWRWYEQLFDQPRWRAAALMSLQLALFASVLATILGTLAAIGVARLGGRWRRFWKLLFVAPMIVPLMVIGLGFYAVFARLGLLGSFWGLGLAHTILVMPFVLLPVTARLAALDPALERAAAASGAGPWRILARVELPLLAPAIAAGFAFAFIFSFDEVVVAQFLTGPTLETLPRRMWEGIVMGGLDNTITAVSTVQVALALTAIGLVALWRRRRPVAMAAAAPPAAAPVERGRPVGRTAEPPAKGGVGITFDRLGKRYASLAAVEDVSLTVAPGEFLTLVGPSGSGKTTLLMLVAGFLGADSGRLLLGGRDISSVPPHRRDIGVVFQNYALFPHMDVRRNVAFPLDARGIRGAEARRRVDEALELVQLGPLADRRIAQLSGGQQQRVALARAIVFGPRALLMDEPLAALDRNLRIEMQGEIRRLQRALGQTVIYVTHDQEEAINLSDRIGVMRGGRLQQLDTPRSLYQRPANPFVAEFFGEANLIRGTAEGAALTLPGGLRLPLPERKSGPAILCVRPELVRLDPPPADGFPTLIGRVTEARFQGSVVRYAIEGPFGPLTATSQISSTAPGPAVGAMVRIGWDVPMTHVMDAP